MKSELETKAKKILKESDEPTFRYGIGIKFNSPKTNYDQTIEKNEIQISKSENIKVKQISEFKKKDYELLNKIMNIKNKIMAYHFTKLNNTIIIEINEQFKDKQEEQIVIKSNSKLTHTNQNVIILCKSDCNITYIGESEENNVFHSEVINVIAENNSNVEITTINNHGINTNYFSKKISEIKDKSKLKWNDIIINSNLNQTELCQFLDGDESESRINTINISKDKNNSDIEVISHHRASNSNSNINSKIILDDNSKSIYRSFIKVDKNCINCNGHQIEKTLLLSEKSKIDAVPILEVENDNVQISHGVSISDIDDEELFYITSKGIEKNIAKQLIINGFIENTLNNINNESTKEYIIEKIENQIV